MPHVQRLCMFFEVSRRFASEGSRAGEVLLQPGDEGGDGAGRAEAPAAGLAPAASGAGGGAGAAVAGVTFDRGEEQG